MPVSAGWVLPWTALSRSMLRWVFPCYHFAIKLQGRAFTHSRNPHALKILGSGVRINSQRPTGPSNPDALWNSRADFTAAAASNYDESVVKQT